MEALLMSTGVVALAEIGDKTQLLAFITIAMAAHYGSPLVVVIGTTLGMLMADVPAVFVGEHMAAKIPMKLVHGIAAALFALLGAATLLVAGRSWRRDAVGRSGVFNGMQANPGGEPTSGAYSSQAFRRVRPWGPCSTAYRVWR